jgi:hypothetical protein
MAGKGGGGAPMPDASGRDVTNDVVTATDTALVPDAEITTDVPADAVIDTRPVVDVIVPPKDMGSDLARNLANGMACVQASQCSSGNCVDGFCCNTSCTNPCQACAMVKTGEADGKCAVAPLMVGMKCGRGCQQFPGQSLLAVVDRVCTPAGQCGFPTPPQNFEYCIDTDPCTNSSCDQPSNGYTARCVQVPKCGGNTCCCVSDDNSRACSTKTSCTGPGKKCM